MNYQRKMCVKTNSQTVSLSDKWILWVLSFLSQVKLISLWKKPFMLWIYLLAWRQHDKKCRVIQHGASCEVWRWIMTANFLFWNKKKEKKAKCCELRFGVCLICSANVIQICFIEISCGEEDSWQLITSSDGVEPESVSSSLEDAMKTTTVVSSYALTSTVMRTCVLCRSS